MKFNYNETTQLFENLTQSEADELWSLCIMAKGGVVNMNHIAFHEYMKDDKRTAIEYGGALFYSTVFIQACLYSVIVFMKENNQ